MVTGRRIFAAPAFALLACALTARAQTNSPVVIKAQTREVLVELTVTDSKGAVVRDLQKSDFTITDDGKPRIIDDVTLTHEYPAISAQPGTLRLPNGGGRTQAQETRPNIRPPAVGHSTAIVLDEANSFFEDAAGARRSVIDLLGKVDPDERIALYVIVRRKGLVLVQDYTTDHELLKRSLDSLWPTGMRSAPGVHFNVDQPIPPFNVPPGNRDEMYVMWRENSDQARAALEELATQLAPVPGRKSVFWMTNAFPPDIVRELGLQIGWDKTEAALNKANVAVNTVDTRGLYRASNQVTGTVGTMRQISEATGGKTYFGRNDLDVALAEGIAASRATYTLRFHLPEDESDNRFHALKVHVDRPGLELFYRSGYYGNGPPTALDMVAGKVEGKALEARADLEGTLTLKPTAQLPWFYTGNNRASVHLTLDVVPDGMAFRQDATGLHGQIEVVGIASRPDGTEAARFADTVHIDKDDRQHADAFTRDTWHYEHPFTVAAGTFTFRLTIGAGPTATGKLELPLVIEPRGSAAFAIGGIAFSTEARPASGPLPSGSLVAGGKVFAPAAVARFGAQDRAYFYTEIYEPPGKNAAALTGQIRILNLSNGSVPQDTGMAGMAGFVQPGNPVVPFATALPLAHLAPGSYRLEIRAGHTTDAEIATRTADFEVR